jgi:hypothetical protein
LLFHSVTRATTMRFFDRVLPTTSRRLPRALKLHYRDILQRLVVVLEVRLGGCAGQSPSRTEHVYCEPRSGLTRESDRYRIENRGSRLARIDFEGSRSPKRRFTRCLLPTSRPRLATVEGRTHLRCEWLKSLTRACVVRKESIGAEAIHDPLFGRDRSLDLI